MVADELRREILSGAIRDGERLPPQDGLLKRFEVSLPAIREALGILEMEGLVTVRRGNVGGAIVHPPNLSTASYMFTLVLESRQVELADVATAVQALEPMCAAMCAGREDRAEAVIPALEANMRELNADSEGEPAAFNRVARQFHELLVDLCGNESMRLAAGALVAIWSAHEASWTEQADELGNFPGTEIRRAVARAHGRILKAVRSGDARAASRLAADHVGAAQDQLHQLSVDPTQPVESALLRRRPT